MEKRITFVESISVAVLMPGYAKAVEWQCTNERSRR